MEARILQFSLAPKPASHCCTTGHLWIQAKLTGYHGTGSCHIYLCAKSLQSCPNLRSPSRLLCPWDFPGKNTGVDAISSYSLSIPCSFSMEKLPSKLDCLPLTVRTKKRLKEKDTIQQPFEAGYHSAKTSDTFQNNAQLSSSLELWLMTTWCL